MSHQFKAGDLALTLIDLYPVMSGSVVELRVRIAKGELVHTPKGILRALEDGWICDHPDAPGGIGYCDTALMPLRGDFTPEELRQEQEIEA